LWKNSRLEKTALATADRETADREPEVPRSPGSPALPNARLNPLLNPLLAKQLGRWAHIYYTASVDKREAAIEKLVCELEAEEARLAGGSPGPLLESSSQTSVASRVVGPVLITGPAQDLSRLESALAEAPRSGALEIQPQLARFEHEAVEAPVPEGLDNEREGAAETERGFGPEGQEPIQGEESAVPGAEAVPESWQELLGGTGGTPRDDRRQQTQGRETGLPSESLPYGDSYVSRDAVAYSQSFDNLLARSEQIQMLPPEGSGWRRPLIVVGVLAVLGGSLWMIQERRQRSGAMEQAQKPQAPAAAAGAVQPPVTQYSAGPASAAPAAGTTPVGAPPAAGAPVAAAPSQQSSLVLPSGTAPHETPKVTNGNASTTRVPSPQIPLPTDANLPSDPDLLAGMRELQGPQRNSAEAARHLWQSVKNQNGSALILLAGLYANGDGVTKDCDQAKILLDAATRQSKSHAQFLRVEMTRADLRSSGCE